MKKRREVTEQVEKSYANSWTQIQLLFLGILICAVFVNIIQFPAIEYSIASNNYPALKSYDSFDLVEIGRKYSGSIIRGRFGPYLGLSQIAPGVDVIVAYDSPLTNEMLYGFGLSRRVERLYYDAELIFPDFDLNNYEIISLGRSKDQSPGNVAIILGNEVPETLVVLKRNDTWYLIDINLLPDEALEELPK